MLTYLAHFADDAQIFNVFRYITFRTGAAMITSFIVVFLFGPSIIATLRIRQGRGQPIRADGPQTHFKKAGTPTMGGLMILSGGDADAVITADMLPQEVATSNGGTANLGGERTIALPLREARDAFEKAYFEFHLAKEHGSMTRVAEKTARRRVPGAVGTIDRTGASNPARRNASTTRSRLNPAYSAGLACCMSQPPQRV